MPTTHPLRLILSPALLLLCLSIGSACCTHTAPSQAGLYQVSTIDALLVGDYDGQITLDQLADHGNLGLGTFDRLDGEMTVLDGKIYQITAAGRVVQPSLQTTTPFACVVNFHAEQSWTLQHADLKAIYQSIDQHCRQSNWFYAIRIDGQFDHVKTRSVPAQNKPYPPLAEVARHQSVWQLTATRGTMLGFRCPAFSKGINVPGYHMHYLNQDRTAGGHVLDAKAETVTVRVMPVRCWTVQLPDSASFNAMDSSVNRQKQLHQIESNR